MADSLSVPVLSTTISIFVGAFAAAVIILLPRYLENLATWVIPVLTIIIVPVFAYLASISGSSIYQYGIYNYKDYIMLIKDMECIPFWNDKCAELSKEIFIIF